ncbi:ParB/RepB/Spo0J family partition protein [Pontiella sulfatireligans]|uniref:Chromosome-partitioning protein Spo0J n=1 Tax=Pontiella sulfatireligans TaxID=2750658 RepID=A0A6C2UIL0_9BACT|nr:ParB N-terminal domain-containing protein [Pontiella sulfatireligans]VGO19154.1 Chromosome-partitioning protein Spo0J [Pontiella sulfatireligans]
MKKKKQITLMADRTYQLIPIDTIVVLNSRNRNRQKFAENIRSIEEVGLRKPIVVNGRGFSRNGKYELVCGEGRFLAHQELGRDEIAAEVIDCDRKTALLYSLVENIARVPPGTMWFAQEMKRMHDGGFNFSEIGRIVGKSDSYVGDYVRLVEQGEGRLITGVEQGLFPMSFAMQVAKSDNTTIQNVLMDAFDGGVVSSSSVARVRRLLQLRFRHGKSNKSRGQRSEGYSLADLKREIAKSTKDKEDFVRETQQKENRLLQLLMNLSSLMEDSELIILMQTHGLATPPALEGKYGVELPVPSSPGT